MKQLDLLPIPRQPQRQELSIRSSVIRNYVRENLRDFPKRQAERERIRKALYEKYNKPGPRQPRAKKTSPDMRAIKVTHRAVFQQPIGVLNPMGLKIPGPQPLELFQCGERWQAREIASPLRRVYDRLPKFATLQDAKRALEASFQERLAPWQIWGKPPNEFQERMLLVDEVVDPGNGQFAWIEPEDRTHIIHPKLPSGERLAQE